MVLHVLNYYSVPDRNKTYGWPGVVKSAHGNLEANSLCYQDVFLWYPHILKGDASGIRTPLTHVHLLQAQNKHNHILSRGSHIRVHIGQP